MMDVLFVECMGIYSVKYIFNVLLKMVCKHFYRDVINWLSSGT